jgi:hypothetical protein
MINKTTTDSSSSSRQAAIIGLTIFFSLNSVLVFYSENFQELYLKQVGTSVAASLILFGLLWVVIGLDFKRIETRACYAVACLYFSLSFAGFKAFHNASGRLLSNLTNSPNLMLFVTLMFALTLLWRYGQQSTAATRHMIYVVLAPILTGTVTNVLLLHFAKDNTLAFRCAFVGYIILFLAGLAVYLRRNEVTSEGALTLLIVLNFIFGGVPLVKIAQSVMFTQGNEITSDSIVTSGISAPDSIVTSGISAPDSIVAANKTRENQPDIYWFILDGYGRGDVLKNLHGYDNSKFLNWLREKGFWIGSKSNSNYMRTQLSISATLRMDFIPPEDLSGDQKEQNETFRKAINHNKVFTFLHERGYETVAFPGGLSYVEASEADVFHSPGNNILNSVELQFYNLTIFAELELFITSLDVFESHRKRFFNVWRNIPHISTSKKPCFVLAHVISPHPPFVFDSQGNNLYPDHPYCLLDADDYRDCFNQTSDDYTKGYLEQITYLNTVLQDEIGCLLAQNPQPVIIIQSDHGSGAYTSFKEIEKTNLFDRFAVINAIFLPDGKSPNLNIPETTSLINTFPTVFNKIFNTDFPMQENRSFYNSQLDFLGEPVEVTEQLIVQDSSK